ncbi:aminoglycoside phosphotransferase family protein [Marinimicrobium alkaliphilum]|uniref:aminoglycoside phosphotransferase family protein n=1 Tax=Marinimicrobium alkaliphilum TaxID=2202654 RepID=UPI000DB98CD1|nr:phosphotransferase [Marinimicrobium alkaliphilum]
MKETLQQGAGESTRFEALCEWASEQLPAKDGAAAPVFTRLGGDAGHRRYFRLNTEPPLLAVDAPVEGESATHFAHLARYLRQHNIGAPAVVAVDEGEGYLLLEDLGDGLLARLLNEETAPALYGEALMTLLAIQQCPDDPALLPRYDQSALRGELNVFDQWFATELLGVELSEADWHLLHGTYERLEALAVEQPQVLVHRDYHSRNLLVGDNGTVGVIDFQDAVWGPITYDLVSLLRDCYVRWPEEQVTNWALSYGNLLIDVGLLPENIDGETYLRWFDWMGLQRHIKVLGVFSRLHLRDGKSDYLSHLPLVIRYTLEVAERHAELKPFADWFRERVLPAAEAQPWYKDYRRAGDASQ